MKRVVPYRHSLLLMTILTAAIFFLTRCINQDTTPAAAPGKQAATLFAGTAACANCHKRIYETHLATAHFHTSAIASAENIRGSFDPGKNSFGFNAASVVGMEKEAGSFYQEVYINGVLKKKQRFDLIFGSGIKGQSYATWDGNHLLQLPITWFTSAEQWSNSPGYPNKISLNRVITARCLECHATYAQETTAPGSKAEAFDKASMILGVNCEKCHGPGGKHVAFQTGNPKETKAQFIINPAAFSRSQSLDMCTLCHGGRLEKTKPSFQFTAGDKLADYFALDTVAGDPNAIDVHGNQYGLLAASKCFRNSKTLTCVTCHNPHANEKGNTAQFSQKCVSCHGKNAGEVLCKLTATLKEQIADKCTSCHMPEQPSKAIAVLLQGTDTLTPAMMHTHFIKAYPAETKKILAFIKGSAHTTDITKHTKTPASK